MVDVQKEVAFFDRVADEGDYCALSDDAYERLLRAFEQSIRPRAGEVCTDLGCGTGEFTRRLRKYALRLIAIDISPVSIESARRQAAGETYVVGDIRRTELADASCDVIVYSGVLHHCPDAASREEVLREGRRILRPSGRLFAFDPSAHSPTTWLYRDPRSPLYSRAGKTENEVLLDRRSLRAELERARFRDIEIHGAGGMTFRQVEGRVARYLLPLYNLYERVLAFLPIADRFGTFLVTTAARA